MDIQQTDVPEMCSYRRVQSKTAFVFLLNNFVHWVSTVQQTVHSAHTV